eukprot:1153447-Pelagomonas_calceolata.AAC.8
MPRVPALYSVVQHCYNSIPSASDGSSMRMHMLMRDYLVHICIGISLKHYMPRVPALYSVVQHCFNVAVFTKAAPHIISVNRCMRVFYSTVCTRCSAMNCCQSLHGHTFWRKCKNLWVLWWSWTLGSHSLMCAYDMRSSCACMVVQVRVIVGALVEVGHGRISPAKFAKAVAEANRDAFPGA